jgi:NADP-dependent 3-hydroxy acid dehydrogenase YdfG
VGLLGPIEHAPLGDWEQMVRLNLLGVLYMAHTALPHLLQAAEDGPRQVANLVNVSSRAGRVAQSGNGVYAATKFGVGAFSESLRQEVTNRHVRVSVVERGTVTTEAASHIREEVRQQAMHRFSGVEPMAPEDIADAIAHIVTRPRRVAWGEILIRPTEQEA